MWMLLPLKCVSAGFMQQVYLTSPNFSISLTDGVQIYIFGMMGVCS